MNHENTSALSALYAKLTPKERERIGSESDFLKASQELIDAGLLRTINDLVEVNTGECWVVVAPGDLMNGFVDAPRGLNRLDLLKVTLMSALDEDGTSEDEIQKCAEWVDSVLIAHEMAQRVIAGQVAIRWEDGESTPSFRSLSFEEQMDIAARFDVIEREAAAG